VNLGYWIKWDSKGCLIYHDVVGYMKCWLRNGCPIVKESYALALIHDLEAYERNKRFGPRLAGESVSEEVVKWWAQRFPEVPSRVVQYMAGQDSIPQGQDLPWNRRLRRRFANAKGLIIHLFSGNSDSGKEWRKGWPSGVEVVTLDPKENPKMDLNNCNVWSYVCHLVRTCRVIAIVGGPPCRSISRLRSIQPGPPPLGAGGPTVRPLGFKSG
jgi:hypothetical protein